MFSLKTPHILGKTEKIKSCPFVVLNLVKQFLNLNMNEFLLIPSHHPITSVNVSLCINEVTSLAFTRIWLPWEQIHFRLRKVHWVKKLFLFHVNSFTAKQKSSVKIRNRNPYLLCLKLYLSNDKYTLLHQNLSLSFRSSFY